MKTTEVEAMECLDGVSTRIEEALKSRKMRPSQMAAQLGCFKETVWTWTSGQVLPNAYNIIRIARVLDVSTDWLLGLSKTGGPEEKGGMTCEH